MILHTTSSDFKLAHLLHQDLLAYIQAIFKHLLMTEGVLCYVCTCDPNKVYP